MRPGQYAAARLTADRVTTEIYDRPATVFVASFIGQANLWAGRQTGRANRDFVQVEVLGSSMKARPGETTNEPGGAAAGIAEYNRLLFAHPELETSLVPVRDGVALSRRRD